MDREVEVKITKLKPIGTLGTFTLLIITFGACHQSSTEKTQTLQRSEKTGHGSQAKTSISQRSLASEVDMEQVHKAIDREASELDSFLRRNDGDQNLLKERGEKARRRQTISWARLDHQEALKSAQKKLEEALEGAPETTDLRHAKLAYQIEAEVAERRRGWARLENSSEEAYREMLKKNSEVSEARARYDKAVAAANKKLMKKLNYNSRGAIVRSTMGALAAFALSVFNRDNQAIAAEEQRVADEIEIPVPDAYEDEYLDAENPEDPEDESENPFATESAQ